MPAKTKNHKVHINEVAPRDGLQFETKLLSLQDKYNLIHQLSNAGLQSIEIGSIVTPAVKQMRGSDALIDILVTEKNNGQFNNTVFQVLATHPKYAEAALDAGLCAKNGELSAVYGLTDENCQNNLKQNTVNDAINNLVLPTISIATKHKIPIRIYLSEYFKTDPKTAARHCKKMLDLGAYEVVPSDTTAIATPQMVKQYIHALKQEGINLDQISFHFHGAFKKVTANIQTALHAGITNFDTATGGIGGCTFAGKKLPNAATEDIVPFLKNRNIDTGINLKKLKQTANFVSTLVKPLNKNDNKQSVKNKFNTKNSTPLLQSPTIENDGHYNFKHLNIKINARGIAAVALNRPEKHNAFNDILIDEITQAFKTLGNDPAIRIIQLSGEGESFCSGADLAYMKQMAHYTHAQNVQDATKLAQMFETIRNCPKGIIGVFHKNVIAGATGLASLCDYNIAAAGTKFAISECKIGLRPSTISPHLIHRMGKHNAAILLTQGNPFFSNRAVEYGLIEATCPPGKTQNILEKITDIALHSQSPKETLQNLRAAIPRKTHSAPYPKHIHPAPRHSFDENHNHILDLIERVDTLRQDTTQTGRDALMKYTAIDIANARTSPLAQEKLRKFLSPNTP